jgi:transcriptional regulator with XRE-family HTH domain
MQPNMQEFTTMDKKQQLFKSLGDREYRQAFAADIGTGLAFQIRALRDKHGWTQEELAGRTGKAQETISQLENPDYGRYTLKTLKTLAAAFDVALAVNFVSFGELVERLANLSPGRIAPPSYEEERQMSFAEVPDSSGWVGANTSPSTLLSG